MTAAAETPAPDLIPAAPLGQAVETGKGFTHSGVMVVLAAGGIALLLVTIFKRDG
jgi:hypothetical protein